MNDELKQITEKLMNSIQSLIEQGQDSLTDFPDVLLGILRDSFNTLNDIYTISHYPRAGSSALDLTRKLIENVVSVEYMMLKDKEKMAKRFKDYISVQLHDDIKFMKQLGEASEKIEKIIEDIKTDLQGVEERYAALPNDVKKDRNWAGRSIEDMMVDIHSQSAMGGFDFSRLSKAYVDGCRFNHLNPHTIASYSNQGLSEVMAEHNLTLALLVSCMCLIRLTHRYIDELRFIAGSDVHEEEAKNIAQILKQIEGLASYDQS